MTAGKPLILCVCTANICRSPFAAQLLREGLGGIEGFGVDVESAGTEAFDGSPACRGLWINAGRPDATDHRAQLVTRETVDRADLVLALSSSHRSALAILSPRSRSKTFTLANAARLVERIAEPGGALTSATVGIPGLTPLDELSRVPKLPEGPSERFEWLVGEMDAWRGSIQDDGSESVQDPHEIATDEHPAVARHIADLVQKFVASVDRVITA